MLLDAAHNPEGARALAAYLTRWHPERPPLVIGVMRDKNVDDIAHTLLPVVSSVIATAAPTPRAIPAADLARHARVPPALRTCDSEPDPILAIEKAFESRGYRSASRARSSSPARFATSSAAGDPPLICCVLSSGNPPCRSWFALFCSRASCACSAPGIVARARPRAAPQDVDTALRRCSNSRHSWKFECSGNHCILNGDVELPLPGGQGKFFADQIELFGDKDLLVASGNVVFANAEGRLAAEKAEFDLKKKTGTFYTASGTMPLGSAADPRQFGNQQADVYFWGETIETARRSEVPRHARRLHDVRAADAALGAVHAAASS